MCRWFAYIGEEPTLLEDILINPKHSIIKQIDKHFLPHLHKTYDARLDQNENSSDTISDEHHIDFLTSIDGFGVGYYTGVSADFNSDHVSRPCIYKNIRPPLNDRNLISLCANTSSKCIFAHIRAGTGRTPTVDTNNHPFAFGQYLFMHNGDVANFRKLKLALLNKLSEKACENIFGTTDTEHVAALFFTHLGNDWDTELPMENWKKAMMETLQDILSLVTESAKNMNEAVPCSFLNFAVTDSCRLVATRFSSVEGVEPPSLYYSTTAGSTLNRKFPDNPDGKSVHKILTRFIRKHGKHVIIASEPNTYKVEEWHLIPANSLVLVDKDFSVTIEKIDL
ncbi:unnamed protein product [Rotaria sp. Silwood1]|nr:unnamed protein product [Rotaria sp. Silwood1]CAF3913736.1 unnamed protein product [Rotaria sp. Silwood1]CAF4043527.1 unnamed protein product [Rotaria sp. Silwood1]CAF4849747.1 unnamed protein product [Rotaria sp. Silwood1]CAF4915422.1 unnamed protein product [Rotaria sp. Silwood1]